ncbi:MAG: AtpZ/AtpI family protein [Candidatus Bipolaricaulota bacterium]
MSENDDGWKSALTTFGRVGQIGFTFVFSVLISVGIGYWIDKAVGTDFLFKLVFLVIGLVSGLWSVYRTLSRFFNEGDGGKDERK